MATAEKTGSGKKCVIIGASHAGVSCAYALRSEGWAGDIVLIDADPELPYHRPPLSKSYLAGAEGRALQPLRSAENYERENIELRLGVRVAAIDRAATELELGGGERLPYDKLVLAVGARALVPPIPGLDAANSVYPLRSAADVEQIRTALADGTKRRVVIIGGGYIGLETAASLTKIGAKVKVIEREERVLARVTTPEMSAFFTELHENNGVEVLTGRSVISFSSDGEVTKVNCTDGSVHPADVVILGVGVRVNTELAEAAGLTVQNGIRVNEFTATNDENIFAIGDCAYHRNPHYDSLVRLESVQNAVDQAKVAAAAVCGREIAYDAIPWFWSDQYDVKLQIVGLSGGYDRAILREEAGDDVKFSIWYFAGQRLLAVDAVNNARAYVIGTKLISSGAVIDQAKLADPETVLKPANILAE